VNSLNLPKLELEIGTVEDLSQSILYLFYYHLKPVRFTVIEIPFDNILDGLNFKKLTRNIVSYVVIQNSINTPVDRSPCISLAEDLAKTIIYYRPKLVVDLKSNDALWGDLIYMGVGCLRPSDTATGKLADYKKCKDYLSSLSFLEFNV